MSKLTPAEAWNHFAAIFAEPEYIRKSDFGFVAMKCKHWSHEYIAGFKCIEWGDLTQWPMPEREFEKIRDAAIELLREAYGDNEIAFCLQDDTYTTLKGSLVNKLREALGISVEELREGK